GWGGAAPAGAGGGEERGGEGAGRAPATRPRSQAGAISAVQAPLVSRIVVKPWARYISSVLASDMPRSQRVASVVRSTGRLKLGWVCRSIKPGISVRPAQSTTVTPSVTFSRP